MKKLGLENKYKEEVSNAENEKAKAILRLQSRIDELTSSLAAKTAECEELKLKYMTLLEQKADEIGKTEISAILQENMAIKAQCKTYETENAELRKQVSYLSLFAPKRSEKQTVDKGENEGGESPRVSEQTHGAAKQNTEKKKETKERKKGNHNGNNGAHINRHEYDDIKTNPPIYIDPELPEGIEISSLEHIGDTSIVKITTETKIVLIRQEYIVGKYKDPKTGIIYSGKVPETPLRGSMFKSAFLALLVYLKFAIHIPVTAIQKMFSDSKFNISETTLNGLINKTANSQFFRNIDMVLKLEILRSPYIMMDETFAKAKTDITKIGQQFITKFYIWVQLSMDLGLVRFSSSGGSRKCEVGYGMVELFNGVLQSDGYVCYKNIERDKFPNIKRIACIQHVKRLYVNLADTIPKARELLDLYNELYIMDHEREKMAEADALAGKEWTMSDHIDWRKKHAPDILKRIEDRLNLYKEDKTILPSSKMGKAIRHSLREMPAIKAIFEQENVLCQLDTNLLEQKNRSISKFRRMSLSFGSVNAGEDQCINFSLAESCRLHNVNVQEYFTFLFEKMPTMNNCIVKEYGSPQYMAFRNLLPDAYAKSHPEEPAKKWEPTVDDSKPIHEGAKRKAYKKKRTTIA